MGPTPSFRPASLHNAVECLRRHARGIQLGIGVVLIAMGALVFRLNIEAQKFLDGLGLNFFQPG